MNSAKEEKIIEIASELFQKSSYLSVGVDKIIADSEVAKMTFYKYFPAKNDLIEKVLERRKIHIIRSLEDSIGKEKLPIKKLERIFDWFSSWFFSEEFFGCMFMKAQEDFPENLKFRKITLEYKNWLNHEITNIFKDAKIKNPEEMASLFIIVLDGLTIKASLGILIENDLKVSWKMLTSSLNKTI
ncbi:MAG TPA: TetR/AcrR family transcriptional regulator [Acinetobacter parvus]|jgi:AcrR family transcriptional regulator|uniref:TetR/AcrR family transcriptional regulator n=1 Tax=Acinetobacter parvus TaxID=134533 RepID=UPI002CA88C17|nr:TetR/AcrR family transcriptional regulator [Acinetobacter parvus]HRM15781.1 TetR/AcrR family transcriptional regulator [Acinetobacter parvus]